MRFARMILITLFVTSVLLACQTANPSVTQEPVIQTDSPGFIPDATDSSSPTLTQEDTNMTPVTPPDDASAKLVSMVKEHLAKQLNISTEQIVLSSVKAVVWRDAGLGCPKPGVDYIQVETPGYNILLEASGKTYRYHTDATKRFVPCRK